MKNILYCMVVIIMRKFQWRWPWVEVWFLCKFLMFFPDLWMADTMSTQASRLLNFICSCSTPAKNQFLWRKNIWAGKNWRFWLPCVSNGEEDKNWRHTFFVRISRGCYLQFIIDNYEEVLEICLFDFACIKLIRSAGQRTTILLLANRGAIRG